MCNLYSLNKGQDAIQRGFGVVFDGTGNLPLLPGIYPDYAAPVVHQREGERALTMMRWGLPSPAFALKGRKVDPGVTNVRNTASPHWRRWLVPEHRCLVPFTSFSENERGAAGRAMPVWFALGAERPLACFACIKVEGWFSTRKLKAGETRDNLFAFLTTAANREVGAVHPKAMPMVLLTAEEQAACLGAPWSEAKVLQRPLLDGALEVVARGERQDGASDQGATVRAP